MCISRTQRRAYSQNQAHFGVFGRELEIHTIDAGSYLNALVDHFDVIYLDPPLRDNTNNKLFFMEHYQPNVLELYDKLLEAGEHII